jgi:hypothetical protein
VKDRNRLRPELSATDDVGIDRVERPDMPDNEQFVTVAECRQTLNHIIKSQLKDSWVRCVTVNLPGVERLFRFGKD